MSSWQLVPLLIAAVLGADSPCRAQPSATVAGLYEAAHKEGLGRWVDAVEIYQRILETSGDDLVPADRPIAPLANLAGGSVWTVSWPSSHFRPARWICHERISRFPTEGLRAYRDRVDVAAARRLEEARKHADDVLLKQLLSDWFCSRASEDAIRLLAERAFERADFDAAERWWTLLLPSDPASPNAQRFPRPVVSVAEVRAWLLLNRLFRGEREEVRRDLTAFRSAFPDASGLLAGKEGRFADTLDGLLADPKRTLLAENPSDAKTWPTYAGHPDRNSRISSGLPRYWPGPPTWRTPIPAEWSGRPSDPPDPPDHPRALAFHPVIANGRVFVADAARIYSFDLVNGDRTTLFDLRKRLNLPGVDLRLPAKIDTRYTLNIADGFLYARLGSQPLRAFRDQVERAAPSAIVCLGPLGPRPTDVPTTSWVLQPSDAQTIFEGTPLVHGNQLYVLAWRFGDGDPARLILCYRGLSRKDPPELFWEREIGRVPRATGNDANSHHELLTLAGGNIIFGSNAGSIVAVDGRTGKLAWEYRYTSSERRPPPIGRDLTPCLFDGFRVFAAPTDSDRLFCLDAFTGALLWDREGVDVVHLLGVTRGRLIATFAGPIKGIRGLDIATGTGARPGGWTLHVDGGLSSFGRGFVTPDMIFWPTKQGLYFLNPQDGSQVRQPVEGMFGNLVYADGCFVVTTATEVIGFVGDGKLLEPPKKEPAKAPAKILIYRQTSGELLPNGGPAQSVPLKQEEQSVFPKAHWQPLPATPSEWANREVVWFANGAAKPRANPRFVELQCNHEIRCGSSSNDKLLFFGPQGATRYRLPDAEPDWSWQLNADSDPRSLRDPPGVMSGRLTGWHRRGNRLYAIWNESTLLAFNAEDGSIVWRHRAEEVADALPPIKIRSHFFVGEQRLLLQLSSGRIRLVDTADGRTLGEFATPQAAWEADPVALDETEKCVAFPEDAESVACFDVAAGKIHWRSPIERPSSRTGSLPLLRPFGGVLLVEIERNFGVEIDALQPTTGRRIWKEPIFVGSRRFALREAEGDSKRIYLPAESGIIALDPRRGERVWESLLGPGQWKVVRADPHLVVHPVESLAVGNVDREWNRLQTGWPTPARLARFVEKSYDAFMARELPVLLLDSGDGKVLQRLTFPAHGPACTVRTMPNSRTLVATGVGVWQLSAAKE